MTRIRSPEVAPSTAGQVLTDAEIAAALRLEIGQFQRALRTGLIPQPLTIAGRRRWTATQLKAMLGERVTADKEAAEAMALEAIERAASKKKAPRRA